jgi:hypothetical protein
MAALAVAGQSAPGLRIAKFGGGSVDFFGSPTLELWRSRPGNKDRIRNLKIARDNCGGLFHVVGVRARDIDAVPCEIADRCPTVTTTSRGVARSCWAP